MTDTLIQAPRPFKGTEIHTLSNGLRLILKRDSTVPVVALQAWARCGAVDETPNIYGISHGLEHMVFKGTPSRSAGEITRAIEGSGGAINAATQLESTHYYIDIPAYGAMQALEVLADTILHPIFPQEELERERLVILEEIHRRDDSPDATLWDEFAATVFRNTAYGIKVIGNEKTVSAMSRDDLSAYYDAHYVPENLTMVVAGDFNRNKMLAALERLFGDMRHKPAPRKPPVDAARLPPATVNIRKPIRMAYFAMGHATIPISHPDSVALDVLADALGGGASSRFYQRLREERQTVLSISCDYIPFSNHGLFGFFAEALPKDAGGVADAVKSELRNLKKDPIQPAELQRAKARIKSDWLHGSETPHGQASTLGSLAVLDQIDVVSTYLPKLESLTTDDLMSAFEKHVDPDRLSMTVLEPR